MYWILPSSLAPEEVRQLSEVQRIQLVIYKAVKQLPLPPLLLYLVAPSFSIGACVDGK